MSDDAKTPGTDGSSQVTEKSKPRVEYVRRTISPYDLTSGDNPGTLISQPLLRGPNYDEWSTNIRLALQARKKFGFADGSIARPNENSEDYEDWCANNALVVSWIKLTITEMLRSSISHSDDAHELWLHIQRRFSVKNGQRVQRLKTELANCRQKGLAIEAYYGKLTQLWASLSDYQRAKTASEIQKEREEDKLHQFLMGLDENIYGSVKSSLLSRDPLPSLDEAYNVLTQDEESKHLGRMNEERTDGVSFAVQISRPRHFSENRGGSVSCTHCGKSGHLAENCFRKIGYPSWWEDKTRNKSGVDRGILAVPNNQAKNRTPDSARANHVFSGGASGSGSSLVPSAGNSTLTTSDRMGIVGLNDAQWKTLVQMLDERKSAPTERLTGPHLEDADWSG